MSKKGMKKWVQWVVDATGINNLMISLGAPGRNIRNSIGELRPTGSGWEPEPRTWSMVLDGLANHDGIGREVGTSGDLLDTDRRIELTAPDVVIKLPDPGPDYIGTYCVKSRGVAGGGVHGTIDGALQTIPIYNWGALRFYCNGVSWFTEMYIGPPS
jgi:hypothetical protein